MFDSRVINKLQHRYLSADELGECACILSQCREFLTRETSEFLPRYPIEELGDLLLRQHEEMRQFVEQADGFSSLLHEPKSISAPSLDTTCMSTLYCTVLVRAHSYVIKVQCLSLD